MDKAPQQDSKDGKGSILDWVSAHEERSVASTESSLYSLGIERAADPASAY